MLLGKWDKSRRINLCLSPPPLHCHLLLSVSTLNSTYIYPGARGCSLKKSNWCPQPIRWSYLLTEKTTMGGLVKGWTQSWWQIFEKRRSLIIWGQRINTKANTKCLFWAWDDRRNVRNFSMLIIMAGRPAFNWDFFVFSKYIFFREQAIHCGQNVCLSYITLTHIIFQKKLGYMSMSSFIILHSNDWIIFWDGSKIGFSAITHWNCGSGTFIPPASKWRSFGKTKSCPRRIIAVHLSNWAKSKTISKFVASVSCQMLKLSIVTERGQNISFSLFAKCSPAFNGLELKFRLEMIVWSSSPDEWSWQKWVPDVRH